MTGFAQARRPVGEGELTVSVKSLNHRGLDIHVHAPTAADPFENLIRSMVKSSVARGHVEVRVSLPQNSSAPGGPVLNHAFLEAYLRTFRESAVLHGLETQPDLNAALRVPGMFADAPEPGTPKEAEAALIGALEEALTELNRFRAREGAEIAAEMLRHNACIAGAAAEMENVRILALAAFQARLAERIGELLKGAMMDPQRLAQEAAILADRSDISEELARLKIHSAQLAGMIQAGGECGKKIDFLLQEMNRETNTILSKTGGVGDAGLGITDLALGAKAAIEKIREQSLNLE